MGVSIARFISMICTVLALSGGLAHSFEFLHKINMPGNDYLIVQKIYQGWALLGISVVCALIVSVVFAVMLRKSRIECLLTSFAALFITLSLVNFFIFTQPVNQETLNWTVMPENWQALRKQWELSHLASASILFTSFILQTISLLVKRGKN